MSSIAEESQYKPILCKNYGKLGYAHYILPSPKGNTYELEKHSICPVCANLAFRDNACPPGPSFNRKARPYPDSKINNRNFVQCEKDSL